MNNAIMYAVTSIFASLIGIAFIFFSWRYYKQKKRVFTTKKMTIYAAFLALFIIQNTIWLPLSQLPLIPWSMESVTVIAVGFLFGPLEGIVYGLIADILGTLISGYMPLPIYMVTYPMIGIYAGLGGMLYRSKIKINNSILFIWYQIVISIFAITPVIISQTNNQALLESGISEIAVYSFAATAFIIFELFGYYFIKRKRNYLRLIVIVTTIAVLSRMTGGWLITPIGNWFYYGTPFELEVLTRIITSSYLTPTTTLISFGIISSSQYAMKVVGY